MRSGRRDARGSIKPARCLSVECAKLINYNTLAQPMSAPTLTRAQAHTVSRKGFTGKIFKIFLQAVLGGFAKVRGKNY